MNCALVMRWISSLHDTFNLLRCSKPCGARRNNDKEERHITLVATPSRFYFYDFLCDHLQAVRQVPVVQGVDALIVRHFKFTSAPLDAWAMCKMNTLFFDVRGGWAEAATRR